MRILLTNDDGYNAQGIKVLSEIMKSYGEVTVVAPKFHQSGMSMAVDLGAKRMAYKDLGMTDGVRWSYLDGTPASCAKFGIGEIFKDNRPDLLVSGINHGSNAATAACYSGTLGAAQEGALNGIPSIGVSLDAFGQNLDLSAFPVLLPGIIDKILSGLPTRYGVFYNINFPDIPASQIKGVRAAHQGNGHWVREFEPWNDDAEEHLGFSKDAYKLSGQPQGEDGEKFYAMVGDFVDDPLNDSASDHRIVRDGYIAVVAHNLDNTDWEEVDRMRAGGFDVDFCSDIV